MNKPTKVWCPYRRRRSGMFVNYAICLQCAKYDECQNREDAEMKALTDKPFKYKRKVSRNLLRS